MLEDRDEPCVKDIGSLRRLEVTGGDWSSLSARLTEAIHMAVDLFSPSLSLSLGCSL